MKKKLTLQSDANTAQTSLAKVISMKSSPPSKTFKAGVAASPTISDIIKMQAINTDDAPDNNEPIVLSDTWYEYSVFKSKFNLSPNTAKKWLDNCWLPYSELGKLRFINKADIENMMLRFRRHGLYWTGWILSFSNEWECLGL